jgi:hypothetical protein
MSLTLHYDFANDLSLAARIGPTLDIVRATEARFMDYDNVLRTVPDGEARFTGCRRVENPLLYSEDLSDAEWTKDGNHSAPSQDSIIATGVGDTGSNRIRQSFTVKDRANSTWTISVTLPPAEQYDDPTAGLAVGDSSIGQWGVEEFLPVAGEYSTHYASASTLATGTNLVMLMFFDKAVVVSERIKVQFENVSGQLDPSPSDYLATTTVAVAQNYATRRRTNISLQSEDFSDAEWTTQRATITANVTTDPMGGSAADKITEDATVTATHRTFGNVGMTVGEDWTYSVYAKAAERTIVYLRMGADTTWFDLDAGVVGTDNSDSSAIEDAGDGWYRCSVTNFGLATDNQLVGLTDADNAVTYSGDGVSGAYIFGMQVEKGSVATEYIATTDTVASSDFDTAITPTGLLVEEARTNICLRSETFDNGWTPGANADTAVADVAVAPDGTLTADQLLDNAATGTGSVLWWQSITTAVSSTYTMSCYFKADQLEWVRFNFENSGALSIFAFFDLTNGVIGATLGADNTSEFIEDVGNGWFRCGIVFESDAADVNGTVVLYVADADNDSVVALDGTSTVLVWGAQVELGAFPTTYIPTVASSVTRNADVVSTTDLSWLNAAAGSFYARFDYPSVTNFNTAFSVNDGATADDILQNFVSSGTSLVAKGAVATAVQFSANSAGGLVGQFNNQAFGYAVNDIANYANGVAAPPDTSAALAAIEAYSTLNVGSGHAGNSPQNGHLAELRYYGERLGNNLLEDLSNGIFPRFQVNDLTIAVAGAAYNDGLVAHYQANGATSDQLNDAEVQYLVARGVTPGDLADMWEAYLAGKSYSGSVTDMKHQWWLAGAPL